MVDFTKRASASASEALMAVLIPAMDQALAMKTKADYDATRGSGEGDVAKKRIGSGYIGVECARELGFRFHKFPKEDREGPVNKGELQRHADSGHWTEAKTAEWLRMCGFILRTDTGGGPNFFDKPKQIGWKAARDPETGQYRMAGEVDGVIDGFEKSEWVESDVTEKLKALIKPPCIWESKKATDKKWKKFSKEGVKNADPKYYGQLQSNMAYMGVDQTLFSMLNLDTMKYYFEIVALDVGFAQEQSDRAVRVMQSDHPFQLVQLGRSEDDARCRYCDFHGACWHGTTPPQTVGIAVMKTLPADATGADVARAFGELMHPQRPVFNPNWRK